MPSRKRPVTNLTHSQAVNLCRRQRTTIHRLERRCASYDDALAGRLRDLSELIKERDHLAVDRGGIMARLGEVTTLLDECRDFSRIRDAQVDAIVVHAIALAQRYVGVKLDTQQFTFAQAQEWLGKERDALFATLDRVHDEQNRNQQEAA